MCFFLCSGEPLGDNERETNPHRFNVSMMQAPAADPGCCLLSCLCPCCAQIYMRRKVLHNDMTQYACCQGYMDGLVPGVTAGKCGEANCPNLCLCLEAFLCNGCAVSSTRMLVMDRYKLQPDEWDNRIIRFNNCIQALSVLCDCLAICFPRAGEMADTMRCIAQCTYASTQGCMTAQVNVEFNRREASMQAPTYTDMERV
ncbi:hypothetical protein PINS_up014161 [Pythium insidiosum]|nr:hypothetical protein PINS_up014161 [Pythium insidiosum]